MKGKRMKHIPDGKTPVSRKQQLQHLREKLTGNQAFGFCRGKFSQTISSISDALIEKSESPTGVLSKLDDYFGKTRVMMNLLAQLRRDNMNVAYRELASALDNPNYLLPGETYPVEAVRTITIVMLEPEKTLTFLRWVLECHWMELRGYLLWKNNPTTENEPGALTKELYEQFDTLEKLARERVSRGPSYEGDELCEAFGSIATSFKSEALRSAKKAKLVWGQWHDHIEGIEDLHFLYVFEAEQSEVLKRFSREDQKRIATWQLNIPKFRSVGYVGLHPKELRIWNDRQGSKVVSRGSASGLKAVVLDVFQKDSYPLASGQSSTFGTYGMLFGIR